MVQRNWPGRSVATMANGSCQLETRSIKRSAFYFFLTSSNLELGLESIVCSETTQVPGAMPWSEPDLGNVHRAIGVYTCQPLKHSGILSYMEQF